MIGILLSFPVFVEWLLNGCRMVENTFTTYHILLYHSTYYHRTVNITEILEI